MANRWFVRHASAYFAALCVLIGAAGFADARGFKFRSSSPAPSAPKVVTPPPAPAVQRAVPPAAAPVPAPAAARPATSPMVPLVLPRSAAAPAAAAAVRPRDSFMSGLTGGLVGVMVGKSIARSFNSPEAWIGLALQILLVAGIGFALFMLVMQFANRAPAYAGVPAGGRADEGRLARVVDRHR